MTTDHVAARTLVKSPPELWAECSDAASLARHIGEFGEITITRLDPETSVAWEAEHASGTVLIEPSAWGTRVTLTAQTGAEAVSEGESAPDLVDEPADQPVIEAEPVQEELDAKVEETVAQQDPAVASDSASAPRRWKRLIARTRAWFRPPLDELAPLPEGIVEEPAPPPDEIAAEPVELAEAQAPEAAEPLATPELDPQDVPEPDDRVNPEVVLSAALDSLGQAHHRPFSRA